MSKTYTLTLKIREGRKTRSWKKRVVESELSECRVVKELVYSIVEELRQPVEQSPGRD